VLRPAGGSINFTERKTKTPMRCIGVFILVEISGIEPLTS
jgi:hypothetical protein